MKQFLLFIFKKSAGSVFLVLLLLHVARGQEGVTVPEGYITWAIKGGTGAAKKITTLSVPFLILSEARGSMKGEIAERSAGSITDLSAGWEPGALSQSASPCLIKITSGAAAGRTLLIAVSNPNTEEELWIDARDLAQGNLIDIGVAAGDRYEIFRCPTLMELFGSPSSGAVQAGPNANVADSLMISNNGQLETYFFSSSTNRWTKAVLGSPNANHTPVRPDTGIFYSRLAAGDLFFTVPGRVSETRRNAAIKNAGSTILAQNWPMATTLFASGIQEVPGWTSGASAASADKVKIVNNGSSETYWFDGSHWRKLVAGSPNADNDPIPEGSAVLVEQLGNQAGYGILLQARPYSLE